MAQPPSVYVRYLSTDVFEGRAACSPLQRLAHQSEDVVPIQPTGRKSQGPAWAPCPVPRQEVLWILREGSHASSRHVQQQVVCLVGIGGSHVAFVATIERPNADGGIGRCEPEQVQREQSPDNPAPMKAIRLITSSFSPRFVVLLVVVLKAQAVPRAGVSLISPLSSWLRKHTLTTR